jgi:hypothetical protein
LCRVCVEQPLSLGLIVEPEQADWRPACSNGVGSRQLEALFFLPKLGLDASEATHPAAIAGWLG